MKKSKAYPSRGTEAGDALVGNCSRCGKVQYRGDPFRMMLSKELLCEQCYKGICCAGIQDTEEKADKG